LLPVPLVLTAEFGVTVISLVSAVNVNRAGPDAPDVPEVPLVPDVESVYEFPFIVKLPLMFKAPDTIRAFLICAILLITLLPDNDPVTSPNKEP